MKTAKAITYRYVVFCRVSEIRVFLFNSSSASWYKIGRIYNSSEIVFNYRDSGKSETKICKFRIITPELP